MRAMICLLTVLLTIGQLFSTCVGEATFRVPAITNSAGSIVTLHLKLTPGNGTVYLATVPQSGTMTQASATAAVQYAFSETGRDQSKCDVLIRIESEHLPEYVEGPSAGVAFSILTYAALSNMSLRNDTTVTGAVDESGNVLKVGGIYEKSLIAAKSSIMHFLTPPNSIHERILLRTVKKRYGIEIIEIKNVSQAINFLFYNIAPEKITFSATAKELPNVSPRSKAGLEMFENVAIKMIALENSTVTALPSADEELAMLKDLFSNEIEHQLYILERGYLFTAANEAFLSYIEASSFAAIEDIEKVDIAEKKNVILNCLNSLEERNKRSGNFEWLIGADLRKSWAFTKIETIDLSKPKMAEEKYAIMNDLMYADAWCHVSKMLREEAYEEGEPINENEWETIAKVKYEEASALNLESNELLFHLNSTKKLLDEKKYGAAIYDAVYVYSSHKASKELEGLEPQQISAAVDEMAATNHTSLWGRIYAGHAAFMAQVNDDKSSAYKLFKYATALDNVTDEMKTIAEEAAIEEPPIVEKGLLKNIVSLFIPAIFFTVALTILGRCLITKSR